MNIHWYPGHMAKAKRLLYENIKLVDIIIEVLDARIPISSHNPNIVDIYQNKGRVIVLNKADMADPATTKLWIAWYQKKGLNVIPFSSIQSKGKKELILLLRKSIKSKADRLYENKGVRMTVRAMIIGIPNVGKSTLINQLAGSSRALTGDKPGVTRGKQWIKVDPYLELMDTPGLLWPKLNDAEVARHLAYIGSIKDEILDSHELCTSLLNELKVTFPKGLMERFKLDQLEGTGLEILEAICKKRGWIMNGAIPDLERGAHAILDEFRNQKMGFISLERPTEILDH